MRLWISLIHFETTAVTQVDQKDKRANMNTEKEDTRVNWFLLESFYHFSLPNFVPILT